MDYIPRYEYPEVELKDRLERVGDLVNFEGPLLSLFKYKDNLYLFDWVDSGQKYNRWFIYQVSAYLLEQFLFRQISYKKLFESTNKKNQNIFYCDIENKEPVEYSIYKLKSIPTSFYPDKETFFKENEAKNWKEIFLVVNSIVTKKETSKISNRISAYTYPYFLTAQTFTKEIREPAKTSENFLDFYSKQLDQQQDVRPSNKIPEPEGMALHRA